MFEAWDPVLERQVAFKVPRRPTPATEVSLSEARAMARLSHPNVLAVFALGSARGRPFLVTEFVDGVDLRAWAVEGQSAGACIDALTQVARGLAAAHRETLVHGDIKPENLLIEANGRVRVADFGLALLDRRAAGARGTPGYLAPEVAEGQVNDARSDQYAWAISAREVVAAAGCESSLPATIADVLARACAADPDDRYPDMDAIVDGLERARRPAVPVRRWSARAVAAVATVLSVALISGVAVGVGATRREDAEALRRACLDQVPVFTELALRRPADPGQRARVHSVAARYEQARADACELSDDERRKRAARCLGWRHRDLQTALELADGDDQLGRLDAALASVPDPARCLDTSRGSEPSAVSPDDSAEERALARGRTWAALGEFQRAETALLEVVRSSAGKQATHRQARALLELGRLHTLVVGLSPSSPVESELLAARHAALRSGDPILAMEVALALADAHTRAAQPAETMRWVELARSEGADSIPWLRARGLTLEAFANDARRDQRAARAINSTSIDVHAAAPGDARWFARALNTHGEYRFDDGDLVAARELYERAIALAESVLGEHHPELADYRGNLAEVDLLEGDIVSARRGFEFALAIRERQYGPDAYIVGHTLAHLGDIHRLAGDHERAAQAYRRALTIADSLAARLAAGTLALEGRLAFLDLDLGLGQLGPWAHHGLALIALEAGELDEARRWLAGVEVVRLRGRERHPDGVHRIDLPGWVALAAGELDVADSTFADAERRLLAAYGERDHRLVWSRLGRAAVAEARGGDPSSFRAAARQAVEADPTSPPWVREAAFELGLAPGATGRLPGAKKDRRDRN